MLKNVRDPLGILLVGLLASNRFDVLRVSKNDFTGRFQDVANENPVFTRGLHTHILAVMLCQPCGTAAQAAGESGESLTRVSGNALVVCGSNTSDEERLVDIHSTTDGVNELEHNTSPQSSIRGNRQGLDTR